MVPAPETDVSSDFPFEMRKAKIFGCEMSYIDTQPDGPSSAPTVLFIHGNPTSSYLWRNIIRHVAPIMRCVAPDLIGMGQSSKPANLSYRFTDHYTFLSTFISTVIPSGPVLLVIQDWGSALGFHWAFQQDEEASPDRPSRVLGLAFMEFIRPFPTLIDLGPSEAMRNMFRSFRDPVEGRELLIGQNAFLETVLPRSIVRTLTPTEHEYYKRPYADPSSREPVFMWPNQIPIDNHPSDVYDIATRYHNWLLECEVPKLFFWADPGALITPEQAAWYMERLKNTKGVFLGEGLHFLQEDHPVAIGKEVRSWAEGLVET